MRILSYARARSGSEPLSWWGDHNCHLRKVEDNKDYQKTAKIFKKSLGKLKIEQLGMECIYDQLVYTKSNGI